MAFALVLVLLLPILPQAEAQASSDPWWGASDRNRPTEGWAVRVPVIVENPFDYRLRNTVVSADIDFGALLVEAGWTSQLLGTEPRLRGFTLDVDSIRVVEYDRGYSRGPIDGSRTEPTPHIFYTSPFYAEKFREFDASRNPSGTVLFVLKGDLDPGQKRYFYVYANPLEYGKKDPAVFKLEDRAPLDAFLWGSTGTTFYGFEPQQNNQDHRIQIRALTSVETTVTIYQREFGKFVPMRSTPLTENPLKLSGRMSPMEGKLFVPQNTAFKIESTHPIAVMGHGMTTANGGVTEFSGHIPSRSGSFRGTVFDVYGAGGSNGGSAPISLTKVSPGNVNVRAIGGSSTQLTNANPLGGVTIPYGQWTTITTDGTGEILVSYPTGSTAGPVAPLQLPAATGGPSGITFWPRVPSDGGFIRVCPEAPTAVRILDYNRPDFQAFPEGPRETTGPEFIDPSVGCKMFRSAPTTPASRLEAYAIEQDPRFPVPNAPVPFRLLTGAEGRNDPLHERPFTGHYGGLGGADFYVQGRTGVFAYFSDTRITVYEELRAGGSVNRTFSMPAEDFRQIEDPKNDPLKTGRYRIVSSKPITVVSTEPTVRNVNGVEHQWSYARIVPGLPENPKIHIGAAEYRGPLVELRSPETDSRQLYRSTGPETPITFRLEAANLGHWIAGESLVDTITIECDGPAEWDLAGCGRDFTIPSGQAERFDITVTPSAEDVNSTSFVTVTARSATDGIASTFRLAVYVEIRYGVGMWFDVEGGRKTIDPIVGVDPGHTHTYNIILKNTGSTRDTFRILVDDPKEGWTQRLLLDGAPVRDVDLNGGESRTMRFEVTAPNTETAPQNLVSITAGSLSTDLASAKDIVNTATRIKPKININLELEPTTRVAEPNETATFNLTVTNRGNDIFRVLFRQDALLPEGWTSQLGIDEIDLGPGEPYVFPLRITPPASARAGDLVSVKISAETDIGDGGARIPGDEVSAVVVVKRIHNITTPALLDGRAEPGETVRYVLPLANHGNGDDLVELLPGADTVWRVRIDDPAMQTILMGLNETADLPLAIDVPRGTPPGLHNLSVTLRLSREATQTLVVPLEVVPLAKVELRGLPSLELSPGRATAVPLSVANVGNLAGNFTFGGQVPDGWILTYEPAFLRLQPGESREVRAVLNASREAEDGAYEATLAATVDGDAPAGEKSLALTLARPDLYIAAVQTSGELSPGNLVIVSATIGNRGDIAAEDVQVALLVDGVAVDQVSLARVTVGERQVATLNWLATSRGADVQVVIDPANQVVMKTGTDSAASVNFGSRLLPAPGPALAILVVAFAAIVLSRRRAA